jgi:hypothetical protein
MRERDGIKLASGGEQAPPLGDRRPAGLCPPCLSPDPSARQRLGGQRSRKREPSRRPARRRSHGYRRLRLLPPVQRPERSQAPGRVRARSLLARTGSQAGFLWRLLAAPCEGQGRRRLHASHLLRDVSFPTLRSVRPSLQLPRFRSATCGRRQPRKKIWPTLSAELPDPRSAPGYLQLRGLVHRMRGRTSWPPGRGPQRALVAPRGEAAARRCSRLAARGSIDAAMGLRRVPPAGFEPATRGLKAFNPSPAFVVPKPISRFAIRMALTARDRSFGDSR